MRAAKSTSIELDGVVVLELTLEVNGESILASMVVTKKYLVKPILGHHLIEHLLLHDSPRQR